MQPADPGSLRPRGRWEHGLGRGLLLAATLLLMTVGRAAWESRDRLQRGAAAQAAGDLDGARLRYGEARLWRLPLLPWGAEAERRLAALPAGPRAALGGAPPRGAPPLSGDPATRFGRGPAPALALLGGLALVVSLLGAARWALTARRSWAAVTLAGAVVTALALWVA